MKDIYLAKHFNNKFDILESIPSDKEYTDITEGNQIKIAKSISIIYYCIKDTTVENVKRIIQDFYRYFFEGALNFCIPYSIEYINEYFPPDELEKYNLIDVYNVDQERHITIFALKGESIVETYMACNDGMMIKKLLIGRSTYFSTYHMGRVKLDHNILLESLERSINKGFIDTAKDLVQSVNDLKGRNSNVINEHKLFFEEMTSDMQLLLELL